MKHRIENLTIRKTKYGTYFASAVVNDCTCGQTFASEPTREAAERSILISYYYPNPVNI